MPIKRSIEDALRTHSPRTIRIVRALSESLPEKDLLDILQDPGKKSSTLVYEAIYRRLFNEGEEGGLTIPQIHALMISKRVERPVDGIVPPNRVGLLHNLEVVSVSELQCAGSLHRSSEPGSVLCVPSSTSGHIDLMAIAWRMWDVSLADFPAVMVSFQFPLVTIPVWVRWCQIEPKLTEEVI